MSFFETVKNFFSGANSEIKKGESGRSEADAEVDQFVAEGDYEKSENDNENDESLGE